MDQIKIGQFIKACRKEQNLTQQQLADALNVSFKTISKWECGNGMMDVSFMLPLCAKLNITVNELLSGCKISKEGYSMKAEENLLELINKNTKANQRRYKMAIVLCIFGVLSLIGSILIVSEWSQIKLLYRILIVVYGCISFLLGLIAVIDFEATTGTFECMNCHHRFVPTLKAYLFGMHIFTKRRLKCPQCGKVTYAKKHFKEDK